MENWKKFLFNDRADVKRLDYVIRYSSIPSVYQESVSQHSYWVVLNSILIHKEICANSVNSPSIELSILKKALIHDIGECVSGDLVRTFKYSNSDFKEAVDRAEQDMIDKYLPSSIKSLIQESMVGTTEDQKYVNSIVKAGDFISLFHYMNREHNRGNREIYPFVNRMKQDMKLMSKM